MKYYNIKKIKPNKLFTIKIQPRGTGKMKQTKKELNTLKTYLVHYSYIENTTQCDEKLMLFAYSREEAKDLFNRLCNLFRPNVTNIDFFIQTNAKMYTKYCNEYTYYKQNHYIYKKEKERGMYDTQVKFIQNC